MVVPRGNGACAQVTLLKMKHTQYFLKPSFVVPGIVFPEYESMFILVSLPFEKLPFLGVMALEREILTVQKEEVILY